MRHLLIAIVISVSVLADVTTQPPAAAARVDEILQQAEALLDAGDYGTLAAIASEARALSRSAGDRRREARALTYFASARLSGAAPTEALHTFNDLVALARELRDPALEAQALTHVGNCLRNLNRYAEALDTLAKAEALYRQSGDRAGRAETLRNLAMVHTEIGDYDSSESALGQALALARETGAGRVEALALNNLGIVARRRGQPNVALEHLEKSLAHPALPRDVLTRVNLLISKGNVQLELNDTRGAIASYERGLVEAKNPYTRALLLGNIGMARVRLGDYEAALALLTDARGRLRQVGDFPEKIWEMELLLAQCHRALGRLDAALDSLRDALATMERLRTVAAPTETSRASVVAIRRQAVAEAVDLLFSMGRHADAFAVAEQSRGRAFLDELAASHVDLRQNLRDADRKREATLLGRISDLQKQMWTADVPAPTRRQVEGDLAEAERDLDLFGLQIRRSNPAFASVHYPETLGADRLQAALGPRAAVVEYLLGTPRSFVWVVTRDRIVMTSLPARDAIDDAVAAYRKALSRPVSSLTLASAERDIASRGAALYDILIKPIEPELTSVDRLTVVADGALSYVPIESLGSPPVLERVPVSYAVSASAWMATERQSAGQPPPEGLVAFGDPLYGATGRSSGAEAYRERGFDLEPLPQTRREVESIAALYPSARRAVHLGANAREEVVKRERLDRYRYIHFAAHGLVDERVPGRSGIALSIRPNATDDGVLQVREILGLHLKADLVTLSACSTGLGKLVDGEGMLGLARAFMYAGAKSVVVSLWNVNDAATSELMGRFYRGLNRGLSKEQALREARLALAHGSRRLWRHPYYWAAFVLIG